MYTTEDQIQLEQACKAEAVAKFREASATARRQGQAADTQPVAISIRRLIEPMEIRIGEELENTATSRGGRNHAGWTKIAAVDPDVAAYITLRIVTGCLLSPNPKRGRTEVAEKIGRAIEDEIKFEGFHDQKPKLYDAVMRSTRHNSREQQRTVASLCTAKYGIAWTAWTNGDRAIVGACLLEVCAASTGFVAVTKFKTRKNGKPHTVREVRFTPDGEKLLIDADEWCRDLIAGKEPMIVPPKPWTDIKGGGYYDPEARPLMLVKGRRGRQSMASLRPPADLSQVHKSLNALQNTAWRVNARVLNVLEWAIKHERDIGGIQPAGNIPIPPIPAGSEGTPEQRKKLRKERSEVYRLNDVRTSRRLQVHMAYRTAVKFSEYPAIYFPHQLDFRGRVYATPSLLSPQGSDAVKALLEFAEGMPIDDAESAAWLQIHLANCAGVDKVSFAERRAWVDNNKAMILAVAADPLGDERWASVDDPWMFLAACMDYAGFVAQGYGYSSHLPVSVDGSCNGLQHYSALLRDPVGGAAVNLIPSDKPCDIYAQVADVTERLLDPCQPGSVVEVGQEHLAAKWREFGITRSLTKQPVMALSYGGTPHGARKSIEQSLDEQIEAGRTSPFSAEQRTEALTVITRAVRAAIDEVVVAARDGMEWLREVSAVTTKSDSAIRWNTLSGFCVTHRYENTKSRQVNTQILGRTIKLTLREDLDTIDARRQKSALPPNFVHALDATHLMMTVNACSDQGVRAFAAVHDSYGTHAANLSKLARILREEFVNLYETTDPFADLKQQLDSEGIAGIPAPPTRGDLDVRDTLKSPYFFA